MNDLRQRKYLFALLALLLVFAACKGESPTAPPPISGPGPGPGTPPQGATIALSVANPNPLTDSSTAITATVTINGQPAPAGTAVEFGTTLGRFEDTGTSSSVRITNAQGQATVSLTSSTAGTANVTAVVNNVVERTSVTFTARPVQPPPPQTAVTITGINPQFGPVEGGTLVTITGTNFRAPVRVFFEVDGELREAFVASVTPTQVQVLTPRINLTAGQTLQSTIVLFNEQGTPNEQRVTAPTPFTFRRAQLTPSVVTISPDGGPLEGGTRITIFGDGFEEPVQVSFGDIPSNQWTQLQVINVTFNRIEALTPPSRDVTSTGSVTLGGHVDVRVVNVNSATRVELDNAFRYAPMMQITAVGPTEGPFTGGTRVTIDGVGFDDPVAVTIGGIAAQPIRVSGTQIVAITNAVTVTGCGDVTGPISVTNINTGASATAEPLQFTFRVPQPAILSATEIVQPGGTITVTVFGAFGFDRLRLGDRVLNITGETVNPDGTTTFTAVVPTTLTLQTEACPGLTGISAPRPTPFNITYESVTTGCTATLPNGTLVAPPDAPAIATSGAFTPFAATATAGNPGDPTATPPVLPTNATVSQPPPQQVTLANIGSAPLQVNDITQTGTGGRGCNAFFISASPDAPATLERCEGMVITARYVPPAQTSPTPTTDPASSCRITVVTNAGNRVFTVSGSTQ